MALFQINLIIQFYKALGGPPVLPPIWDLSTYSHAYSLMAYSLAPYSPGAYSLTTAFGCIHVHTRLQAIIGLGNLAAIILVTLPHLLPPDWVPEWITVREKDKAREKGRGRDDDEDQEEEEKEEKIDQESSGLSPTRSKVGSWDVLSA